MTRRKIINREELLVHKVGVRFDDKTYSILRELLQKTNCRSIGELVRRIVEKDKIVFYSIDSTLNFPMVELTKIREELKAIGRNVNQITHHFHIAETASQKLFDALRVKDQYNVVNTHVEKLLSIVSELAKSWLGQESIRGTRFEIKLENFDYKNPR
jgi:hypothetical protein